MKQRLAALTLMVILGSTLAAADDPTKGKTTVEVVSLTVTKKHDKAAPGSSNSTSLSIEVAAANRQFLGVDPSSTISEFKDDKGASLLSTGFLKTQFSTNPFISKDRTAMVVTVYSNASPGKAASKIQLKGQLVVKCGLDEKTTEEKEVEMKLNATASSGDFTLKVTQEKGFAFNGPLFTIETTAPVIKTVHFKDADGKAAEVVPSGNYGFGKKWTYTFYLKKEMKKGKFTVTYFSKEEKVTVPVEVSVGVGL